MLKKPNAYGNERDDGFALLQDMSKALATTYDACGIEHHARGIIHHKVH